MTIHAPLLSIGLATLASLALAADPPAATAVGSTPAAVTSAAAPAANSDSPAIATVAHSLGYKSRQHEGKTLWCKSENRVGTNFQTTTCLTEEQVMAAAKRSGGN
jgi:hypothetical protein